MRNGWHHLALCALSVGVLAAPLGGETSEPRGRRHPTGDAGDGRPAVRTTWPARIAAETLSRVALAGTCGDSILDAGEQCDDGNATPGDGCSDTCQIEPGFTCTEPIPPASGTNIVADPSFEAGTPNPSWAEFSSNFPSPICNIVDCGGDDGGTGPATGDWWAWFGGFVGGTETYSLSQSLVIPTTATTLEFELEQILCDSADDLLEVTLDGVMPVLFTTDGASPLCGVLGYSTQSVDISGFADGSSHTLELSGQTVSTNGGVTDFFVEDLVISDNVPLPPVPSECFAVGPLGCDGSLVDFDNPSAGIPSDWTVIDNEGTGVVWTTVAGSGEFSNYTGGTGEAASVSSRTNSGVEFDTELRAPFDLSVISAGATATLTYLANYQNSMNSDFLELDISTDGGASWISLLSWNEDHGSFLQAPGESVTIDLSAYAGLGGLLLRWHYYDPNTGDSAWYAQIDDVRLTCDPAIALTPTSLTTTQLPDTQEDSALTVFNIGFGDLIWTILETPTLCTATSDVSWLSLSPTGGTTGTGLSTPVTVTTDATGLATGDYEATLCIASNDPVIPEAEVPVTMTVASCTPGQCDDGNPCTADSCEPSSGCVNTPEPMGTACGSPSDTECSNPDTCDGSGVCDPRDESAGFLCGDAGTECVVQDTCDGSGSCDDNGFVASGTTCGNTGDGVCDLQDTCDGSGTCDDHVEPATISCDDGNACTSTSTNAGEGDFCSGAGSCDINFVVSGGACGDGSDTECTNPDTCDGSGTCQANHEAGGDTVTCGDTGTECVNQDYCAGDGTCTDNGFVAAATACGDASDTECTNPDTCDGSGSCQANHEAGGDAVTCGDAGTECVNQDYCNGDGTCTDNGFVTAATACGDASDTECTNPDTCDGSGSCQANHEAGGDTVTCGDTGTECINQDYCAGDGTCTDNGFVAAATACGDASDAECTNPDTCDGSGTCLANHEAGGDTVTCGDTGTECVNQDYCNGDGTCADNGFVAAATACGDASDTECTNPDTCDGSGSCQANHEAGGDRVTCGDAGTECVNQDYCAGDGTCTDNGFVAAETACGDASDTECTNPETCDGSGTCQANHEAGGDTVTCGDTGTECVNQDYCDGDGTCTDNGFVAAETPCGDASDTECTNPDTCDGSGSCQANHEAGGDTVTCGDAGTECVNQDYCAGDGTCTDNGFVAAATACGDASDTECTNPDTCDGSGSCQANHEAGGDTVTCGDTGAECINQDYCAGDGTCTDNGFVAAATACGDASDTECTNPDTCDGSGSCQANHEAGGDTVTCGDTGTECINQDYCAGDGTCTDNGFVAAATACGDAGDGVCDLQDTCDGAGTCDDNVAPPTTHCEDGNECTTNDLCSSGECVGGAPLDCDDGLFCTGVESCAPALGCQAGTPPSTEDGVGCTDDSCDEINDLVVNAPNDANCDNGEFCDGAETCDAALDCQAGSDPCPGQACDETGDVCADCLSDGECDDGQFCNGGESCVAGACEAGTPPSTDDGVACTDDSCDEDNDVIVNTANDANCSNGQFCDGVEVCDDVIDCQAGSPPDVDDGVGCTDDSCDEVSDAVVNAPNDANCDNGEFCDGAETCDDVIDCQAGSPPDVDDGVGCTDDSCDEVSDAVVNAPNDANCDNGEFCDGAETCDAALDCQAGSDPCPGQACDETGDVCADCLSDGECDDGQFCNGGESCVAGACTAGTPPSTDDGVACTDDSCDEDNDVIVNTANDANCSNGQFCDGAEVCDAVSDCQAGPPPSCNDGLACTLDACNETTDSCDNATIQNLVLSDTTLVSGEFVAQISITAGPNLVIDGPVQFIAGDVIKFVDGVSISDGFSAEVRENPCP